jgi:DNA-binding MarR family transcriptional regulator
MALDTNQSRNDRSRPTDTMTAMDHSLSFEALKRFRMVFRAVQQHSLRVEQRCGLTSAQLWAMSELAARPGQRVSELAHAMSIHASTASNLLDKLERKGLIEKQRQRDDQRVVLLTATPAGLNLLELAPSPATGILQSALFLLSPETLQSLIVNLDTLVAAMKIDDDGAALQPLSTGPER